MVRRQLFRLRFPLLDVEDDLSGNPGGNAANLGASRPAVAAHLVKGRPLFRDAQAVDLAILFLMDLPAERLADFSPEPVIDSTGVVHRLYILLAIFEPFPSNDARNGHDGPGKRPARFSPSRHPPGERASRLEDLRAAHVQFFLQSCKNGLGSAEISHVVLKRRLENLL